MIAGRGITVPARDRAARRELGVREGAREIELGLQQRHLCVSTSVFVATPALNRSASTRRASAAAWTPASAASIAASADADPRSAGGSRLRCRSRNRGAVPRRRGGSPPPRRSRRARVLRRRTTSARARPGPTTASIVLDRERSAGSDAQSRSRRAQSTAAGRPAEAAARSLGGADAESQAPCAPRDSRALRPARRNVAGPEDAAGRSRARC